MTTHFLSSRRCVIVSAGLLTAVALTLVVAVIPPVKADLFPLATPQRAAIGFWVHAALAVASAVALAFMSFRATVRTRSSTALLSALAVIAILLALALTDAAFAFGGHGAAMQPVCRILFLCAAVEVLTAALIIAAARLRPTRPPVV